MLTNALCAADGFAQYIIFAAYILIIIVVAIVCRRKSASVNEFLFSKKGVGGWLTAFAYGATYFSAVVFVGYAGKFGYNFGLSAVWIGIGNTVIGTYIAWQVLARRTKIMTNNLGARTMPEFFEKRYDSKHIKLVSSIVIFIFLIPYSSSVYQGLGYVFEQVIGLDSVWCILILACLTALYLFFGGYFATSITDFIQGIIMIIGIVVTVFVLLASPTMNWGEGLSYISQMGKGLIPAGTYRNRDYCACRTIVTESADELRSTLVFDAQTSGGLLLAVPEARRQEACERLAALGEPAFFVGRATPQREGKSRLILL